MLNFIYKKEIENLVFHNYIKEKKSSMITKMILNELQSVKINISANYIKDQIKYIENQWLEVQSDFLEALGDFYEKDLFEPNLTCYLIRLDIFPYDFNKGWFTAPFFITPAERNRVIMHELCHYYQPEDLPREIKEAIPVILNDHEKFRMFGYDRGHKDEKEQEWRKKIWNLHQKGGKFSDLLKLVR